MVTDPESAPEGAQSRPGPTVRRRLLASLLDLHVIVGWIVFTTLLGPVMVWLELAPSTPAGWDVYAFSTLVLPTALTFAALEASPQQAAKGKRHQGLKVVDREGRRLTFGRSLLRQAFKFGPWQMAHTAVFRLVAGEPSALIWSLAIGAQLLVIVSAGVTLALRPRRALHDRLAQTRVVDV